jgi:hypothetical protein
MNKKRDKINFVLGSVIGFLGIELIARMYNWYTIIPIYDLVAHVLFGVAFYSLVWYKLNFNKPKSKQYNFQYFTILYIAVALIWEWLETIGDLIFVNISSIRDIFFFDGLTDVIIGFVGLIIAHKYLK